MTTSLTLIDTPWHPAQLQALTARLSAHPDVIVTLIGALQQLQLHPDAVIAALLESSSADAPLYSADLGSAELPFTLSFTLLERGEPDDNRDVTLHTLTLKLHAGSEFQLLISGEVTLITCGPSVLVENGSSGALNTALLAGQVGFLLAGLILRHTPDCPERMTAAGVALRLLGQTLYSALEDDSEHLLLGELLSPWSEMLSLSAGGAALVTLPRHGPDGTGPRQALLLPSGPATTVLTLDGRAEFTRDRRRMLLELQASQHAARDAARKLEMKIGALQAAHARWAR